MKVAYKWRLDCDNFAYIVDGNGDKPYVGPQLPNDNEIIVFVKNLSRTEYRDKFNVMESLVKDMGFNTNFLQWSYYYDLSNDICLYRGQDNDEGYAARVNSVTTGSTTDVSVSLNGNVFEFDFVIVPSKDGANGVGVPTGGTSGQFLIKNGNSDYDTRWGTVEVPKIDEEKFATKEYVRNEITKAVDGIKNRLLPQGGALGQSLVKNSDKDYDVAWKTIKASDSDDDPDTPTPDVPTPDEPTNEMLSINGGKLYGNVFVNGKIITRNGFYEDVVNNSNEDDTYGEPVTKGDSGYIINGDIKVTGKIISTFGFYENANVSGTAIVGETNNIPKTGETITIDGDLIILGKVISNDGFYDESGDEAVINNETTNGELSDIRLKNIISTADLDIEKIINLSIIYFTYKNDEKNKQNIGVIAQEIAQICPEIASKDSNGYLSVDYSKLSLLSLYCIKDLYNKIKNGEK